MSGKIVRAQNISGNEESSQQTLQELFEKNPVDPKELLSNLGLFIKRQDLMRILMINDLYRQIVDVPGDIYEFGVRWGQNLSLFTSMRGIYEPYNFTRRIYGFDTFEGFKGIAAEDGQHEVIFEGAYGVGSGYETFLDEVLTVQSNFNPVNHIKKHQLYKGDAFGQLEAHLDNHAESIIALAYFDFDIYKPTKQCLELIKSRLTKGSIVAFDELNHSVYPGETVALREVFGLDKVRLIRPQFSSSQAYFVYE